MSFPRYLVAGGLVLFASLAWAHNVERSDVRTVMNPLPALLKPVTIQLMNTMAPEVLVENHSSYTLVIYDHNHEPFIRIGPKGVDANLTSPAWYVSRQPEGTPTLPKQVHQGAPPKWVRVSKKSSFGWFDRRIAIKHVVVPDAIEDARQLAKFSHWQIPVAFAGHQARLSGQFLFIPPATGYFESRLLDSSWSPQKNVSVSLTPGRQPAIYISNTSGEPVVVYGRDDKPYLRIGPKQVDANVRSASWIESHPRSAHNQHAANAKAAPQWQRVAGGSRYAWVDLRVGYKDLLPPAAVQTAHHSVVMSTWQIPLHIGKHSAVIKGETLWLPYHHSESVGTQHRRSAHEPASSS